MVVAKKARHRSKPESAAGTLDELESISDRVSAWLAGNPRVVLGAGAAILVVGGAFGFVRSNLEDNRLEASAALAATERDYRVAMGADLSDLVIGEPANPETAERVRGEYIERYRAVADEHPDSGAGAVALLEAGVLQQELGRSDDALATWAVARERLAPTDLLTALVSLRIAAVREEQEQWIEAGEAFEIAAAVVSFPLRYGALADAARCFDEAGEEARALAAYARVEAEAPDFFVPEHVESQLRELKVRSELD